VPHVLFHMLDSYPESPDLTSAHLSFCLVRPRARVATIVTPVLLAGVAGLWLGGGLHAAGTPASLGPGHEVDQHLFRTTLTGAHVGVIKATKFTPAKQVLVINAWVTNPTGETLGTTGLNDDAFWHGLFLRWKSSDGPRPKLIDARGIAGTTLFRALQPRLPTYVAVEYDLATGTRVPDRVTVALASYSRTDGGILDPRGYWDYEPKGYEKRVERDPITGRTGPVTHIIPVLAANVRMPVRR
jgi:hypothetical protein